MNPNHFTSFKDFLHALISPTDTRVSSKTVVGLLAFAYVLIIGFLDFFTPFSPTEFVFFGILGVALGAFSLNTLISTKQIDMHKSPDVNVEQATNVRVEKTERPVEQVPPA
jgi:hypothetical protein